MLFRSQGKLTEDLYKNFMKCETLAELEDLYAPYKKKKKTRAMIAIEKQVNEYYTSMYPKLVASKKMRSIRLLLVLRRGSVRTYSQRWVLNGRLIPIT